METTREGLRVTFDYRNAERRLRKTIHLLQKLESVDRLVALNDLKEYSDREWLGFEKSATHRLSEVVSDLRNTEFVLEHSHIIDNLVRVIRDRQEEGKFVQAEKWNNIFNHYELCKLSSKGKTYGKV